MNVRDSHRTLQTLEGLGLSQSVHRLKELNVLLKFCSSCNLLLVNCLDSWICAQYDRERYKQWIHRHTHTKKPSLWQLEKLRLDCILVFLSKHSGLFHPLKQLVSGSFVMTKL